MQALTSATEFEDALDRSRAEPVLLYKHSDRCSISTRAREEVLRFDADVDCETFEVVVQEARPVSDRIADALDIRHETPQAILLRDGRPVFDASHSNVTADSLQSALQDHSTP